MADEENLEDAQGLGDNTSEVLTSTPTQDELPDFINLPGVSASGIQAAASALREIRTTSGVDEISDSELNVEEDLENLAVRPVEQATEDGRNSRLSGVSR